MIMTSTNTYTRTEEQNRKKQYDNMKRIEKQKLALEKLQSDEFEKCYVDTTDGISDANNALLVVKL